MRSSDMAKLLGVLLVTYPQFYRNFSDQDMENVVALWTELFADEPAELVMMAVKEYIHSDQSGFPPVIGKIAHAVDRLKHPDDLGAAEAWALVRKAAANGFYGAEEEFRKLPPEVRVIVGNPGQLRAWAQMDVDTLNSVIGSNFQRAYREQMESIKRDRMTPEDVKARARQYHLSPFEDREIKRLEDGA
nr:MAG TPA: replisome organizer [Caudoviricetes sp.]